MKPTRPSLAVAAVLVVAVLAVPAAAALNRKPPPLHAAAKSPPSELRASQVALARAAAQLARIRTTIAGGTLQQRLLQLQWTLGKAKRELRSAEAGLRTPLPLAVAVEQVRHEVAYVRGGVPWYSRGQLVSEAAMDYVAGHVSDTEFGYLRWVGGRLPSAHPNSALRSQAGICAAAAVTFAAIVHRFGFPVRSVIFNYLDLPPSEAPDGHVAVEVLYDGGWHFFDPTYGLFWTDADGSVLSVGEARAGRGTLQKNVASFTNVFEDAIFGDDTWFETDPATEVVVGSRKLVR